MKKWYENRTSSHWFNRVVTLPCLGTVRLIQLLEREEMGGWFRVIPLNQPNSDGFVTFVPSCLL